MWCGVVCVGVLGVFGVITHVCECGCECAQLQVDPSSCQNVTNLEMHSEDDEAEVKK